MTLIDSTYEPFLKTPSGKHWKTFGLKRRSGVATPLFFLYSQNSIGIGDFSDLKLMIDWCAKSGLSLLQLLPLNDTGFAFRPYDAQSSFALDPMYLDIQKLEGISGGAYQPEIESLKSRFKISGKGVVYGVKKEKIDFLRGVFEKTSHFPDAFQEYAAKMKFWLPNYSLFKAAEHFFGTPDWEKWPEGFKNRKESVLTAFRAEHEQEIRFHHWLQWQCFLQLSTAKQYGEAKHVSLMGDLPFLVSRKSAEVWSHQDYFKLELASGAPPDAYFASGQRWGMPPYNWKKIEKGNYDLLIERLKYAEHFYHAFRVDHAVGLFRLWTIPIKEPVENQGLNGMFDPQDESEWEAHGRNILDVMIKNTEMLPCAEDLGVVPECSYRTLREYGICGTDIGRWTKDERKSYAFQSPELYRKNSIAALSTHDSSSFKGWWLFEAGTVDEILFKRTCATHQVSYESVKKSLFDFNRSQHGRLRWLKEVDSLDEFRKRAGLKDSKSSYLTYLYENSYDEKAKFLSFLGLSGEVEESCSLLLRQQALNYISQTKSIFSIQMLQDWFSLEKIMDQTDPWEFRINFPGTENDRNWSLQMPISLEEMLRLPIYQKINTILRETDRTQ